MLISVLLRASAQVPLVVCASRFRRGSCGRMVAWCERCEVPEFWCPWWSLQGPWDPLVYLGVSGGSPGFTLDWDVVGAPGSLRSLAVHGNCQGLPRELWKSLNKRLFHGIFTNLQNRYNPSDSSTQSYWNSSIHLNEFCFLSLY